MNKNKALLAGAAMVALSMPLAQKEAKAASATLAATAVVVDAIQLATVSSLHFGTMSVTAAGTITISPAGARSSAGGINLVTGAAASHAGQFTITGAAQAVTLTTNLPRNLTAAATQTMTLNALAMTGPWAGTEVFGTGVANTQTATLTAAATAGAAINVGGTLNAAGALTAGTFNGNFTLTASYQ